MQCIRSQVLPGQTQVREGASRVVTLLTGVAVTKVVPGNSCSVDVAVSQSVHKTDGRGWCSLGGQLLYFTTHRLSSVFNLSHLLRKLFFLQIKIKVTACRCFECQLGFREVAGFVSGVAMAENQADKPSEPKGAWKHQPSLAVVQ